MIGMVGGALLVFCDHCHGWIEDAKDGNYYWVPRDDLAPSEVFFNHKACAYAFEQSRPTEEGTMWYSGELIDFPIYLGEGIKLKWGEARKHARLMRDLRGH